MVLMEHPPKQGLKHCEFLCVHHNRRVLMEHPPKQGLKHRRKINRRKYVRSFNGTSTKTRIETCISQINTHNILPVLMEHPPKQGLKHPPPLRS